MHQPFAQMHAGNSLCMPAQSQTPPEVCNIPTGGMKKEYLRIVVHLSLLGVICCILTWAKHLGHLQSPLGTSCRGGIRQKVW